MTVAPRPGSLSAREFLALERDSSEKHVLWDGAVFAMAGGSLRHNLLVAALLRDLGNALVGHSCRPFASDQRVRLPGGARYVYPDATVACPPFEVDPDDDATLLHPTLVAEVLSPSTEAFDRGDKFIAYRAIPSLQHYVLVSQAEPRVEHFVRDEGEAWRLVTLRAEDELVLGKLAITIRVADLYAGVPATPVADR